MKPGDLVTVHPAACGVYLIVKQETKDLFVLYGEVNDQWFCAPMERQWIEIIQES